jgi:hypothetical protein
VESKNMRKGVLSGVVLLATLVVGLMVAGLFTGVRPVKGGQDRGQEILGKYADRADHSRDKVKFHLALMLMKGGWTDVQRDIILRGINAPTPGLEGEAAAAFSRDQMVEVFYRFGTVDVSDLKAVYGSPFGKSAIVHAWTAERKADLWRQNLALGFVRFDLTLEQQLYLVRLAQGMPLTRESSVEWEREAVTLFPRAVGRVLFATIGDGHCGNSSEVASLGKKPVEGNCVCTTHAGNWSCNDTCSGSGTCSVVAGDCGFLWLYDCNGMCNNGNYGQFQ